MKTVYISIGNSDGKLTQKDWSSFCTELMHLADGFGEQRHGTWFSAPHAQWQNMCVHLTVKENVLNELREELRDLASCYRQDSIVMAVVDEVEMVKP